MTTLQQLADQLWSLRQEGGTSNRLLLSAADSFFVFHGASGDPYLMCESSGADHSPAALQRAGFHPRPPSSRPSRLYNITDQETAVRLAQRIATLLEQAHQQPLSGWSLHRILGSELPTENPALIEAMRDLSRSRSHAARLALYRQLLQGTFLLAVESEGSTAPAAIFGDISGWAVYGVFTDQRAWLSWDPRGVPYRLVPGRELFPALMQTAIGALKINPRGVIGGELYRNEIETIATAVRRFTK